MTATSPTAGPRIALLCALLFVPACDAPDGRVPATPVEPAPTPDPVPALPAVDARKVWSERIAADPSGAASEFLAVGSSTDPLGPREWAVAEEVMGALPTDEMTIAVLALADEVLHDTGAGVLPRRRAMALLAASDREGPRQRLVDATLVRDRLFAPRQIGLRYDLVHAAVQTSLSREQLAALVALDDAEVLGKILASAHHRRIPLDLTPFLEHENPFIRDSAAWALVGPDYLTDESANAVRAFLSVAEQLPGADEVWEGFDTGSPPVGEQTIYRVTLRLRESPRGLDVLREWVEPDVQGRIGDYAAVTLANFAQETQVRGRLVELSRSASSLSLRASAIAALAEVGTPADLPLLRALLSDDTVASSCTGDYHPIRDAAERAIAGIEARGDAQ